MLNFCSLYSGSTGNSLFVESNTTKILIDAGVSAKKIQEALLKINTNIEDLDAILITHEHVDHVRGIGVISKKYNIPIYSTLKTWSALDKYSENISVHNKKSFNIGEDFEIGNFKVSSFEIPHDAVDPCGFNVFCDGKKLSIATDVGHITADILTNLKDSDFIMLEANHDPEILKCGNYPYILKQRILGSHGHMSNSLAAETICKLANNNLKNVMLGHLSKENNFPELAYKTVEQELINNNLNINLNIASPIEPSPIINVS